MGWALFDGSPTDVVLGRAGAGKTRNSLETGFSEDQLDPSCLRRGASLPHELVGVLAITRGSRSYPSTATADWMMDSQMRLPSVPPVRSSEARSGWGIMPRTLPRSLMMPAMFATLPFGFAAGMTWPAAFE
jgi:hypothetical protein